MINDIFKNIIRFIALLFVQLLVVNQIELSGYVNPYLYVLFIIMLPINWSKHLVLILSMLVGFCMDIFSNTLGMHTSACLLIGFLRPFILNVIAPREDIEIILSLDIKGLGLSKFFVYASLMVLIHHLWLYILEAFTFLFILDLLLRVILSSFATLLLILLSQMFLSFKREST
ncbi:MAG: rod shape-determining protein MreD [Flavobacteriales bacterium]